MNDEEGVSSLGEAAARYLAELSQEERTVQLADINRFTRWFGSQRPLISLTASEIENYAERMSQKDTDYVRKLEIVKLFLSAAKKAKWTKLNLATSIKIRKPKTKKQAAAKPAVNEKVMLTKEGQTKLEDELAKLKVQRLEIIEEIRKAAADKDFRENVPFHAAREQKGHVEGRIQELEGILKQAETLDSGNDHNSLRAALGNTVVLCDLNTGDETCYILVNPREVDLKQGKISSASPIGQAVMGKSEGDTAEVSAPVGKLIFQIKSIR